jgi:hypothetical protein
MDFRNRKQYSRSRKRRIGLMIDFRRHGKRCSAKQVIRSEAGIIEQSNQGTIAFETENLGRQLILVDWDKGVSTYAFANEINIIEGNHPGSKCSNFDP